MARRCWPEWVRAVGAAWKPRATQPSASPDKSRPALCNMPSTTNFIVATALYIRRLSRRSMAWLEPQRTQGHKGCLCVLSCQIKLRLPSLASEAAARERGEQGSGILRDGERDSQH